jgi:YbbR domain-containing protein
VKGVFTLLRRIFVDDIGLKLFSGLVAVILFAFIHGAEQGRKSVYVDVLALVPQEESGRILMTELPARVRLMLAGSQSRLAAIRSDSLPPIQLDLRSHAGGEYRFSRADLDLPVGVRVEQWNPAAIELRFEERDDREIPIRPSLAGELPSGLRIARGPEVEPKRVKLVGPASVVADIDFARLEPIELTGLPEGTHSVRVGFRAPPEGCEYVGAATVPVTLEVAPARSERAFDSLEVSVLAGKARSIRPRTVDVIVAGPQETMGPLRARHLVPYVDASELTGESGAQPLEVRVRGVPDGAEVVRVLPREILVTP